MEALFGLPQSQVVSLLFSLLSLPHSSDSPACLRTRTGFPTPLQNRRTDLGFCLVCVLGQVLLRDFSLLWPVAMQATLSASSTWVLDSTDTQHLHMSLVHYHPTIVHVWPVVFMQPWPLETLINHSEVSKQSSGVWEFLLIQERWRLMFGGDSMLWGFIFNL